MSVSLKFYLLCGCLRKSESWSVVGFCPHVDSTGVFGININTLYSTFWSLKEVFRTNKAIRVYGLYHPHLAIGF